MPRDGHKSNVEGLIRAIKEKSMQCKQKYEGMQFKTKYGTPFVIKEYIDHHHIIIEFPFSGIQQRTHLKAVMSNPSTVIDPFYKQNGHHRAFVFKNPADEYLGGVYQNSFGEKYKIVDFKNTKNVTVEFMDENKYKCITTLNNILKGGLSNPYRINTYGGYMGEGILYRGSEYKWLNRIWSGVLLRSNRKDIMHKKGYYSYDNCSVCPEWLNYSLFSIDYMNKYLELNPEFKYEIDKDLLYEYYKDITNEMKYYSADTTVLLPKEINTGLKNMDDAKLEAANFGTYNAIYKRILKWIEKINWYKSKNGLSEISYFALMEQSKRKLEMLKNKYPEYEQKRLENGL